MLFPSKKVYKDAFLYQANFHHTESALLSHGMRDKSVCCYLIENVLLALILNYWMRFCDIQNNQGRGTGYQPKPKAEADNP